MHSAVPEDCWQALDELSLTSASTQTAGPGPALSSSSSSAEQSGRSDGRGGGRHRRAGSPPRLARQPSQQLSSAFKPSPAFALLLKVAEAVPEHGAFAPLFGVPMPEPPEHDPIAAEHGAFAPLIRVAEAIPEHGAFAPFFAVPLHEYLAQLQPPPPPPPAAAAPAQQRPQRQHPSSSSSSSHCPGGGQQHAAPSAQSRNPAAEASDALRLQVQQAAALSRKKHRR